MYIKSARFYAGKIKKRFFFRGKIDRKCGMCVSFQLSFPNFKHEKKI